MADKLILEFQAKTDDLDKRLKAVEGSVGNVGKTSKKVASDMTKDLEGVKDVASQISPEFGRAASAMGALTGGVGKVVTAMKTLRGVIIATGIGALVFVIASISTAVSRLQPVMDAFGRVTAGVGAAIDVVLDRVAKFGQGLVSIAQGNLSQGIDQIKASFSGLGDEMEREIEIAVRLKKEMQDFEKAQIVSSVAIAKLRSEIERLNATYGDTTVSIKEQVAAQQEILKLREKISEAMVKEAREALKHKVTQDGTNKAVKEFYDRMTDSNVLMMSFAEQAQLAEELTSKIGISESGNEDLKEVANLIKAIIAAEDERVQGARRTNAAINGLIAQEAAARKKAADDAAAADKLAKEQRTKDEQALKDAALKIAEQTAQKALEIDEFVRQRRAVGLEQEMQEAIAAEQAKAGMAEATAIEIGASEETIQAIRAASVDEQLRIESDYRDKLQALEDAGVQAVKDAEEAKKEARQAALQKGIAEFQQYAQLATSLINGIAQAQQQASDYELQVLQNNLEQGNITREEFDQKRRQILRKQAEDQKALQLMNAIIGTAAQVAQNVGNLPLALAAAALGAIQIGIIASEPLPEFAEGGYVDAKGQLHGRTHRQGGIHIEAEGGEFITKASQAKKYGHIVEAVNKGTIEKLIAETYVRPAVDAAILNGWGDLQRSVEVNAAFNDMNLLRAIDRHRASDKEGFKYLAAELSRNLRQPKRGYA